MQIEEHFYTDDPATGPADAKTTLQDTAYFFLGNGHLSAAIQLCQSGEGTPLGLLLMAPQNFGPKCQALSFDPHTGLSATALSLQPGDKIFRAGSPVSASLGQYFTASWDTIDGVPCVVAQWQWEALHLKERFYCPDRTTPRLLREIFITSAAPNPVSIELTTGCLNQKISRPIRLIPGATQTLTLEYRLVDTDSTPRVQLKWVAPPQAVPPARKYWNPLCHCTFDNPVVQKFFDAAKYQLPANIAHNGRMDASIWQYNLEWVRDQSMVVLGLLVSGQFELAGIMLRRLLREFVTPAGDTIDSGRIRDLHEVELDQNGELLLALKFYHDWTGDEAILHENWDKIRAVAEFPLQPVFRHPQTALLHNRREFWERHTLHGIEDGMELAYQFFVSLGLFCASRLAECVGHAAEARRWENAAMQLKRAMLQDPKYRLIEEGHFIKRRKINGEIQREIHPPQAAHWPRGIPLSERMPHILDPDTAAALPIAWEFIDPSGTLARNTLREIERLWNQRWIGGGYGRYHVTSEPDSPGPWPFASLFVARAYLEAGELDRVWRVLRWLNTLPGAASGCWFEFYGPRPIPPCPQIGVVPWTWAEMLLLLVHHVVGFRPEGESLHWRPRLLPGMHHISGEIPLRKIRICFEIHRARNGEKAGLWLGEKFWPYLKQGMTLPTPGANALVTIVVPA